VADSQGILGTIYATGRGVPQDDALARKWLTMASDKGIANAQFIFDLYYPDPVNGPRLPEGVVPGVVKFMEKQAREQQCSPPQSRQQRRAGQRRNRQREAPRR
jgi:TPR repeat protein